MDSASWDARYAGSELVWSTEPNAWVVAELAGRVPAGDALDLATGEGRNAIWLARQGWRVTGVDFSQAGLDKAARLAAGAAGAAAEITWLRADLLDYLPEPGRFDLVLVCYLQLVAAQRSPIIRRAARALASGGELLVIGHDLANLTDGVGGPQDPSVLFTPADILADTDGIDGIDGLEVLRADTLARPVPGADRDALDAVVRLRRG